MKNWKFWGVLTLCVPFCAVSCSSFGVIGEIRKHDSFNYQTWNSVPEAWFGVAYASMEDPFVYIVLSDTGSPSSRIIGLYTGDKYNHASLSFDRELRSLISYNGGDGRSTPGMNPETIEDLYLKDDASVAVYGVPVSKEQKAVMLERIEAINREGSSYNFLGLVTEKAYQPNIMFCSQFVYAMLDAGEAAWFRKNSCKVKPMDFARYRGNLSPALVYAAFCADLITPGMALRQAADMTLKEAAM
ncbi:hypothetical protein FACS189447_00920 [Spirochaetia bacterium]|nr:hypothetical protein FACS189447_00920 [Spirochaetia bacterium]